MEMQLKSLKRSIRLSFLLFAALLLNSNCRAQESTAWVNIVQQPQYFAVLVSDVDASVEWYTSAFGLEKAGGSAAEDGRWRIENLTNEFLFVEIIRDDRVTVTEKGLGFAKVGFYVPDVELVANRVAAATGEKPRVLDFEEFNQRLIQIHDPDGNIIQLTSSLSK